MVMMMMILQEGLYLAEDVFHLMLTALYTVILDHVTLPSFSVAALLVRLARPTLMLNTMPFLATTNVLGPIMIELSRNSIPIAKLKIGI